MTTEYVAFNCPRDLYVRMETVIFRHKIGPGDGSLNTKTKVMIAALKMFLEKEEEYSDADHT